MFFFQLEVIASLSGFKIVQPPGSCLRNWMEQTVQKENDVKSPEWKT